MKQFFSYWLWPNPAGWHYEDSRVMALLALSIGLIVLCFVIGRVRHRMKNPITRSLTAGWPTASLWFGIVALVLTVSRVETIQFLSMRLIWAFWLLSLGLYIFFQMLQFRRRHYTVIQQSQVIDEREKYLPKKRVR